jgi:hypothetical protein
MTVGRFTVFVYHRGLALGGRVFTSREAAEVARQRLPEGSEP